MAASKDYLDFLLDQLSALDGISYRMMMGEYIIYYREKIAAYVCDGRFLVKPVPSAVKMLPDARYEAISEGGKKKLLCVENVDDREFLTELFREMYKELPSPKIKRKASV